MALDFLKFGRESSKGVVGVDISSTNVKLLELTRFRNFFRVESFAVVPLQQGAVVEKNISDSAAVASALRKAVAIGKFKSKEGVVAVSGSSVIIKTVQMDASLNDEQLETQIALEADQYIPYPLEEVAVDFVIQGPAQQANMVDVLVVASRRENVNTRADVLSEAGLNPRVVDVEAFAIERAFSGTRKKSLLSGSDVVAIVDIGSVMTTLNVIVGSSVEYTREQLFGSRLLLEDIQRRFELSFEEAALAQQNGSLPEEYYTEILQPFKTSVVQHISRALKFFFSSGKHQTVNQVVLTGEIANLDGLVAMVEESLGVSVSIIDPFADMQISAKVSKLELNKHGSSLLIACGLAMRSLTDG